MLEAINEWIAYCRRNYAPGTVMRYERVLQRFSAHTGGKSLTQLAMCDVETYLDTILRARRRSTTNAHLMPIKSFFHWQAERHGVPNITTKIPRLLPDPPDQRVITEEEYAAVMRVAEERERARPKVFGYAGCTIQFLAHTGIRRQEFSALLWRHVSSDMSHMLIACGKGRKPRIVPLDAVCRDLLTRHRDHDIILFVERYGRPGRLNRLCTRLAILAGIEPFGPHALRHFFTTRMVRAGKPMKIVSKILGHANMAITEMVYCHLLPEDLIGQTEGFET